MPPRKKTKAPEPVQQLSLSDAALTQTVDAKSWWSVGEVLALITQALDDHPTLGQVMTVRGELSNVRPASSGHVYFTLKDTTASLNAVMWRSNAAKCVFKLEDGMAVLATGQLNLYAPGGSMSLVVQKLEPEGIGALQLAYEQLKAQLSSEGLFDRDRKKPLPPFPMRIGMITSPTGAVLHDMLRVLRRKNPLIQVLILPVAVQGEVAACQIADAIETLNAPIWELDALILARGGGSLEDLFCFSQEIVVRAVVASRLPIITGIGHQPDFGLADAAADFSAATATAAAETLVPDSEAWRQWVLEHQHALMRNMERALETAVQRVDMATTRLTESQGQRLSLFENQLQHWRTSLKQGMTTALHQAEMLLTHRAETLNQLSPLTTLSRGYAVITGQDGQVMNRIADLKTGDVVSLRLQDGQATASIVSIDS